LSYPGTTPHTGVGKAVPAEFRHIVFRPTEVINGVRDYRRRMRRPLPSGYVRRFAIEAQPAAEGGARVVFEIGPDDRAAIETIVVTGAELAAAMILYCGDRKIPLPISGSKTLEKLGDGLALIVTLNTKGQEAPALAAALEVR
jgi:hypothetical protein